RMALRKGKARRAHAPDAGSHSRASERAPSKRGGSKRNGAARSALRRLIYWSLVLALWALIAAVGTIAFAVSTLPPIQTLEVPKRAPTIEIVGTDGRPLITRGEMSGTDISIKELPPYLPRAFVAIEDRRFFSHFGIDPIGLIRAAAANVLRRGVSQGGSTITKQLEKNLFLTRARAVLAAMTELGFVTETMAKSALAQPTHAIKTASTGSLNYVADWIMDVLDDLVGRVEQDLVVETSIDPTLQAAAEKALTDELALKGQKLDVAQGALVAITPEGAVRAMVGGRNYAESQFNRAVAAKRQPGSAFKPFVYLTALERGLTPETVREDKPVALKGWKPEN